MSAAAFAEVDPRTTDPNIDNWLDPHVVARDPRIASNGNLLLFLGGSYGVPGRQRLLLDLAAGLGYHAINLSYPNSWMVARLCAGPQEIDCYEAVRLDILDGRQRTQLVEVNEANAVLNRIERLLVYLARTDPEGSWSDFLGPSGVNWQRVVVAGHSQGGGHAALLAKLHHVARVVMLAAPFDFNRKRNAHAPWLERPGRTPAGSYYGFTHERDSGYPAIRLSWELMGMGEGGDIIDVDTSAPPYGNSQRLISRTRKVPRDKFHACVALDRFTPPGADKGPLYLPVWRYLLGS